MRKRRHILPVLVFAQFCCTSIWFAGNGVIYDLIKTFNLDESALGHLTSAVQLGFILGTLLFAMLSIVDRFAPSTVFLISAMLAAGFNLALIWEENTLTTFLIFRFLTGFFLAGIYPVGMKIAADYYDKGLGKSLGYLVGALVLGTSLPHLLKDVSTGYAWELVIISTSTLAAIGGFLLFLTVPNGPFRKPLLKTDLTSFVTVFKDKKFRSVAFGYFGHMWELYAFWAFVPAILTFYSTIHEHVVFNISILSFLIIGIGSVACVLSGYVSQAYGLKKTARLALTLSAACCLFLPFVFMIPVTSVFIGFMIFWGMVVIADSPLLSTLVAQQAPAENKGTALTIVNCIGFAITIGSIQLLTVISSYLNTPLIYAVLALGPILGFIALGAKVPGAVIFKIQK